MHLRACRHHKHTCRQGTQQPTHAHAPTPKQAVRAVCTISAEVASKCCIPHSGGAQLHPLAKGHTDTPRHGYLMRVHGRSYGASVMKKADAAQTRCWRTGFFAYWLLENCCLPWHVHTNSCCATYACQVWSCCTATLRRKLDGWQALVLSSMTHCPPTSSTKCLQLELGVL
jgi:hypothetical protein